MRANEIMAQPVIAVRPDTPVHDVARLLLDHGFIGVPVVTAEGRLVGIITEADLIVRAANVHFPSYLQILDTFLFLGDRRRYSEEVRRVLGSTAEQIMTPDVIAVRPDTEVGEVARLMFEKKINPVPVLDGGRVIGVISRSDIIRHLIHEMEADRAGSDELEPA
jgi:CBS domain-containing protein